MRSIIIVIAFLFSFTGESYAQKSLSKNLKLSTDGYYYKLNTLNHYFVWMLFLEKDSAIVDIANFSKSIKFQTERQIFHLMDSIMLSIGNDTIYSDCWSPYELVRNNIKVTLFGSDEYIGNTKNDRIKFKKLNYLSEYFNDEDIDETYLFRSLRKIQTPHSKARRREIRNF